MMINLSQAGDPARLLSPGHHEKLPSSRAAIETRALRW
jgi:hypothetical protein